MLSATPSPATWRSACSSDKRVQQRPRRYTETASEAQDRGQPGLSATALVAADLGVAHSSSESDIVLRDAKLPAYRAETLPERGDVRLLRAHRLDDLADDLDHAARRTGREDVAVAGLVDEPGSAQAPHGVYGGCGVVKVAADVLDRPDRLLAVGHQVEHHLLKRVVALARRGGILLVHGSYGSFATAPGQFTLSPGPIDREAPNLSAPRHGVNAFRSPFRRTHLAAVREGRKAIGVEISERYCEMAAGDLAGESGRHA